MCMTNDTTCFPVEASRGCGYLKGATSIFSFFSAWERTHPNEEPCEKISDGKSEKLHCDEDFYEEMSVATLLRITQRKVLGRGGTSKAFMYFTDTVARVQLEQDVSRGLYKNLRSSFMMSKVTGPGFVPAVSVWFSTGGTDSGINLILKAITH